jgi:peroxiredoxin Q/BCP
MKRSEFIKSFILFSSILFIKPSRLFASINSITLGKKAPNFLLNGYSKNSPTKKQWSLDDFSKKWLVLYFYPKDFSSGCTLEAKNFQDNLSKYIKINASIVGISADSEEEHESFCTSEKLGYTLLSDANSEISKSYDSWLEPYSKRNTFLINPEGIVVYKWIGVRPIGHAQEVLEELAKQQKIYA